MKIDIHYHCIPEEYISTIRKEGSNYPDKARTDSSGQIQLLPSGDPWRPLNDKLHKVTRMIQDMEETGRDMAVLSVAPTLFHYELDAETGEKVARKINDGISQMVSEHPDRFMGMATVPLQHPPTAIKELERAVKQLGMQGVEIGSNVNGKNFDKPELFPFFEKAQSLSVLIFVHPTNQAGRERMLRYHLRKLDRQPN